MDWISGLGSMPKCPSSYSPDSSYNWTLGYAFRKGWAYNQQSREA